MYGGDIVKSLGIIVIFLAFVMSAKAAMVTVSNTLDTGAGSLRNAVASSASNDTITFNIPANSSGCTGTDCVITLSSEISFPGSKNLTIDGGTVNTVTLMGTTGNRVFNMPNNGGRNITLIRLKITGGSLSGLAVTGGGINFLSGGALVIDRCTISGNSLSGTVSAAGGGLYMSNGGGTLTITNSTFSGNSISGVLGNGAGLWTGVATTLANDTISGNVLSAGAGSGAGIYINNSGATTSVDHLTITNNSASGLLATSGGIDAPAFGTVTVRNTVVAGNSSSVSGPDLSGGYTSDGYNLIGKNNGSTGFTNGTNQDQVGTTASPIDPKLSLLTDLGGPTETHSPLVGSPLMDKGKSFSGTANTADQRGFARPVDLPAVLNASGGNASDIGAYEVQTPLAAGVMISGRATDGEGNGVGRATLILIGGDATRQAITNAFGYYTFEGVESGRTYILSITVKDRDFIDPIRVLSVNDAVNDVDFTANPAPTNKIVSRPR